MLPVLLMFVIVEITAEVMLVVVQALCVVLLLADSDDFLTHSHTLL
jgi:hypothetical protein